MILMSMIGNVFSKPSGLPLGPFEMDVAPESDADKDSSTAKGK